jgi:hypothetical protein
MYTREQIEQHIWDYIDGLSTPQEKLMVEKLLHTDPVWRSVHEELTSLHTMINGTDLLEEPSMRFNRNVMEEVSKYKIAPPASSYINKKIIFGIAAFFLVTILGLLGYVFMAFDFSSASGNSTPLINTKDFSFDFSKYFNSTVLNLFLFMDVIAGLLLLDRYLRRKKEKEIGQLHN